MARERTLPARFWEFGSRVVDTARTLPLSFGVVRRSLEREKRTDLPVSLSGHWERSGPRRALVVDPDPELLAFAATALGSFRPGFDVATARSIEDAAAWLETFYPDLLILAVDRLGDNVDGFMLSLRSDRRTSTCSIIALADRPSDELRLNPARVRADALLARPIGLRSLLGVVRRLM